METMDQLEHKDAKVTILVEYDDDAYMIATNCEERRPIAATLYTAWHDWMIGVWG